MFIDIDVAQEKKYKQNTFGDYFTSKRFTDSGRLLAVLSDGLGSGIKANILACMTSTMLLKFMEEDVSEFCLEFLSCGEQSSYKNLLHYELQITFCFPPSKFLFFWASIAFLALSRT